MLPSFVDDLIEAGVLGDKVKHGFCQKAVMDGKKVRLSYDPAKRPMPPWSPRNCLP